MFEFRIPAKTILHGFPVGKRCSAFPALINQYQSKGKNFSCCTCFNFGAMAFNCSPFITFSYNAKYCRVILSEVKIVHYIPVTGSAVISINIFYCDNQFIFF